jgi:hypothetical protein
MKTLIVKYNKINKIRWSILQDIIKLSAPLIMIFDKPLHLCNKLHNKCNLLRMSLNTLHIYVKLLLTEVKLLLESSNELNVGSDITGLGL